MIQNQNKCNLSQESSQYDLQYPLNTLLVHSSKVQKKVDYRCLLKQWENIMYIAIFYSKVYLISDIF